MRLQVVHPRSGRVLADRAEVPRTPFGRGWGLMFRSRLEPGQGMWIAPCNGIHMFFMRFAIDAVFLDRGNRVLRTYPRLGRWRMVPLVWGAHGVLELPSGTIDGLDLEKGEELQLVEV
jgi:uncharacterized membrane protein (UPF0127 family)